MKSLAQYQNGKLELQETPKPTPPQGGMLIRTTHTVISPGTEKMKVEQAKMNLLQKAKARPDQVKKVLETARTLGWKAALEKVKNRLESPTPLGYSAAGIVEAVDPYNTRFQVGDRVAVGGAECAWHAEYIAAPDMLVAKIPEGVENWQAAYTTMASISMHAVRQSGVTLGERVLVLGQGLVGLLCTAILKAAGARVLAVDFDDRRLATAIEAGAELAIDPRKTKLTDAVSAWTGGYGVDRALVCTAAGNGPIEQAVAAMRDRGVMVIVGITDATLAWKELFHKEIEVRYSRSYGPGRYDAGYEWGGQDYPIGYVRWTENRNFDACLELMRTGQLDVGLFTSRHVPYGDCLAVYEELTQPNCGDIGVVLNYPGAEVPVSAAAKLPPAPTREQKLFKTVDALDVIGAGNFARTMLLPSLKGGVPFGVICNQTPLSARHVKEKFGFQAAETDSATAFAQKGSRAVIIGTRHHLHAPMVIEGLKANRHIFVEKPLCLTREEMAQIDVAYESSEGSVMVGFNRRFAPATVEVKKILRNTPGPKTVAFHVFPGELKPDHWFANYAESGGRILGEGCHFLDFFCHMIDSDPVRVSAQTVWSTDGRLPFPDSVTAQVEFADGSCGQLIYTAQGDYSFPKEVWTVYAAGLIARCENFQTLEICKGRKKTLSKHGSKGHAEEMQAWQAYLQGKTAHPLPYAESRRSMHLTFGVLEAIQSKSSVNL
jgi:predicted dehydrogenase/threonine dehydrogenase-like Zn-dependent dehydrogenase